MTEVVKPRLTEAEARKLTEKIREGRIWLSGWHVATLDTILPWRQYG
jgi:hypothetical protein